MLFKNIITNQPFKQWLLHDPENKQLLWFSTLIMLISFGWIKYLYPYPNFMPPDSYNYMESARNNDFINMWPIGYSKFLRLLSVFSRSHMALVIIQYLLLIGSITYFLFSIRYLFSVDKWLFRVLFIISISNPLLPHIANFVSSDALFAALSLIWFTQLLWIIYRPTGSLLLIHTVVILLAFTVRFTGIYYPLLSLALIFVKGMPTRLRWLSIGGIALTISAFIGCTQYEYKKRTGVVQFSAFGGWQLAANALYGYAFDQPVTIEKIPAQFKGLHNQVTHHMDSIRRLAIRPDAELGIYYQWDFKSPLLLYLHNQFRSKKTNYFEYWASVAPLYSKYGRWLISEHPVSFLQHYLWPNMKRYYAPPPFFMGYYIMGNTTVDPVAVDWFQFKNKQLLLHAKDRQIHMMTTFTTLLAIINPAFLISALYFTCFAGFKQSSQIHKRLLVCMLLVWFANMLFSVVSAPIELRYQIFPVVITVPFMILFVSWIIQSLKAEPRPKKKQTTLLSEPIM
jgi:hypothetical protein